MKLRHVQLTIACLALVGVMSWSATANATLIVAWDSAGLTGYGSSPLGATFVIPTVTVPTGLTRGSGIGTGGPSPPANVWGGRAFDTANASAADAIADSEFATLVIQPAVGYQISFNTMDANFRRSSDGPNTFQWQYDAGSGFVNIGSSFSYLGTDTNGLAQPQINLSLISALQNVSSAVTFRLVMWGATHTNGNWGFGRLSGNDLAFDGTVVLIPEPGSAVLISLACGALVAFKRRRQ